MKNQKLHKIGLFFSKFRPLHYKKGETVLRAGDPIPGVYYIKRGFIRLCAISDSGEELTLVILKSGDIFPISWAMKQTQDSPKNYYIESTTLSELYRVSRDEFLKYIKSDPEAMFEITSAIAERYGVMLIRAESIVFGDAYNRVASILLLCARRFGKRMDTEVLIEVPLTHNDVAALIGVARETASIEIQKLEKAGIIDDHGKLILIKSMRRLRNAAFSTGRD